MSGEGRAIALGRRLLLGLVERISDGTLELVENGETRRFGVPSPRDGLAAKMVIHRADVHRRLLLGGSVGAGEAYMAGDWSSPDLVSLVRLFARNREVLYALDRRGSRVLAWFDRLFHALRRNTVSGSRRNIAEHYDLGEDFYRLFLDPTLSYSCACFASPEEDLETAQRNKIDRLCRKLDLGEGDRLLEIGSGWGAFAVHAARHYGARVTTTTISPKQHAHCEELFRREGLSDRITLLRKDYRELEGRFDKLVSVEMIEAVGHQYLDGFFEVCGRLLERHGLMALQAITLPDGIYEKHVSNVDFIKRHVFPGSCIPTVAVMLDATRRCTDLRLVHLEDISAHYARTLRLWRERFLARSAELDALGFDEVFRRKWEYYLAYCEGSFAEHLNGDVQMVFARPGACTGLLAADAPLPPFPGRDPARTPSNGA